eukprot:gene3118-8206_t
MSLPQYYRAPGMHAQRLRDQTGSTIKPKPTQLQRSLPSSFQS